MDRMTYSTLRVREQGTTRFVQLHRPEADNAINAAMVAELSDVLARASASPTTVVVLEGLPGSFCSGADFTAISEAARQGRDTAFDPEAMFELFDRMAYGDCFTIAHVRGRANAGGLGLVAASDVVIADGEASFGLSELLFGLLPAIVLPFLIRRVGFQRAHYLAGTTHPVDGARAAEWGLVDAFAATDSQALLRGHLQRLGRLSKDAVRRYKAYLRELAPIAEGTKGAALAANRQAFQDPGNVRAIRRYSEQGLFPWEQDPAPPAVNPEARGGAPRPRNDERPTVSPQDLGNPLFRQTHGVKYNYLAGAMYKGIASVDLVTAMGNAGMLAFFGTGGLRLDAVDDAIIRIRKGLGEGRPFGMNLLNSPNEPGLEMRTVELFLQHDVRCVEASAYIRPSLPLVRYHLTGLNRDDDGRVRRDHRVIAKVSRAEVAEQFMRPAPAELVRELLRSGLVTREQAELGARIPLAQDICVEADSAGHTDGGNASVLIPAMRALRDRVTDEEHYAEAIRIGAAGGIGTPEAALAAFMLGAEFIATGSVNQCTVEAGTSEAVKDILQDLTVHDTDYAPAGDMFEVGAKVQAVKKGLFFPARAKKLYDLYLRHDSLEEIDDATRTTLEAKYFRRSLDAVWEETRAHLERRFPERLAAIERNPKQKMAHVFRWYFAHTTRLALAGSADRRVDYQIHCGPAMGAFNSWVQGTGLEPWRARHVDAVAEHLMRETAALLARRLGEYGVPRTGVPTAPNDRPATGE